MAVKPGGGGGISSMLPGQAVGPFRGAWPRKTPIHGTWFPPFRQGAFRTAGPGLVPPRPTGVLNTMTGTRTVKIAGKVARLPAAARPNAAASAPRGR